MMDATQRCNNYSNQDLAKHRGVVRNCPMLLTPKQRKRIEKKSNAYSKRYLERIGMTFVKSPF